MSSEQEQWLLFAGSYGNCRCNEAVDLVCSQKKTLTLSYFNTSRCTHWNAVSLKHIIKPHGFLSFHTILYNKLNYFDRFTMASNVKVSFAIRVTDNEWVFSCPSFQSILFLCTLHIWGLSNFPRLLPQIHPCHTVFCIFMCVLSYLNPSYYSHGWPCQGEICSLTVNGPILTARPPHQRSVLGLSAHEIHRFEAEFNG